MSSTESLIVEDIFSSFQEMLDKEYPSYAEEEVVTGSVSVASSFEPGSSDTTETAEIPVLLEAAKAFESGVPLAKDNLPSSAKNDTSRTKTVKTDEKTEVEFNENVKHDHTDSHHSTADEPEEIPTDNCVLQCSDPLPLLEHYGNAGDTAVITSAGEIKVKPIDVSGLCLDSLRKPVKDDSSLDENFSGASAGDSTFVLKENEGNGLIVLQSYEIIHDSVEIESPKEIPVSLEAAKVFEYEVLSAKDNLQSSAENGTSRTKIVKTDEKTEVEFNETVRHSRADVEDVTLATVEETSVPANAVVPVQEMRSIHECKTLADLPSLWTYMPLETLGDEKKAT